MKLNISKQLLMQIAPKHVRALNRLSFVLFMLIVAIVVNSCSNATAPNYSDSLLDIRDGQQYKYITIGTQIWMAENLNYNTSNKVGSWCYHDSDYYCNIYGRLYNWATAMEIDTSYNSRYWGGNDGLHRGICPNGWHIPSDTDWMKLFFAAGNSEMPGTTFKSKTGWDTANGIDLYGFNALPGGENNHGIFVQNSVESGRAIRLKAATPIRTKAAT